tara:strand:+ start:1049 stop:2257 length:1209 start_codon:yes stop_codon:yes gene_type:complete
MNNPAILYFIRGEADLERISAIAIPGKAYAKQYFAYYGDIDLLFDFGIKNKFQKELLIMNDFQVLDVVTFSYFGKFYKWIRSLETNQDFIRLFYNLIQKILNKFLLNYQNKDRLAEQVLKKIKPTILITDNSVERENYFPHLLRQAAIRKDIKVHVTGHGPAGGLHKEYHEYSMTPPDKFEGCVVGICSKHDYGFEMPNRVITGDPADSFPHLIYKHEQTNNDLEFLNKRKYKIGFFMSAPFETCTNSWAIMEDIMLDYSFQDDIAMVAKFHPRLYRLGDYRYLKKINNLKLFGPELDRTRLVKWADIIVCSDHCSMLFEGMIFQKKVVAIHSKKVRPFAKFKSKIHSCDISMNSIYNANEFSLDKLKKYTSDTKFINEFCWGDLGKADLGELIIKDMVSND